MAAPVFQKLFALACALLLGLPAAAQDGENVRVTLGYAVQTDSNLFRLPSSANTQALLGAPSAAEHIDVTTLGLNLQTRQGLQSLRLDASLVDYQYRNFDYLSFTATNYNLAWLWALTPRLTGNLSSGRKETLNSYADYQGYSIRNQRLETSNLLDLMYEVDGPWRLLAGAAQTRQTNQQALTAGGDFSSTSTYVGVRHAYASGSHLSYRLLSSQGTYLNRVLSPLALLDDRFTQTDHDLRFYGVLRDGMQLDAHVTAIDRSHPNFPQRNYSGVQAGTGLNWAWSGKSTLALSYARELGAYATTYSNYSQTDRVGVSPVWLISARTQLGLRQSWARIAYLGSATGANTAQRRDDLSDTTLFLSWRPREAWTLMASVQNQRRRSSLAGLDFDSDMASLSAQYSF